MKWSLDLKYANDSRNMKEKTKVQKKDIKGESAEVDDWLDVKNEEERE